MAGIAINVLWFLIGLIILCGIIYLAIWVIEQFVMAIPPKIKQGVWVIVLLLALIYLIMVLAGGGGFPKFGGFTGGALAALPAPAAAYLHGLLR